MGSTIDSLRLRGYAVVPGLIEEGEISTVARAIDRLSLRQVGTRNLLERPWCRALVQRVKNRLSSAGVLPDGFVGVQCTLFDKTPTSNWLVALHQDLSIPVRSHVDRPELGPWSIKEGTHFVQPPQEVLERLLAVRVHVDDCSLESGPLRVVPGSHTGGRLEMDAALQMRAMHGDEPCLAVKGDALVMRPLLLHASSKARSPSRRRVVHILFAPPSLPFGLEWQHAV